MKIKITISQIDFKIAQFTIVTIIICVGLLSYILASITGHHRLLGLLTLLDVGVEESIPTYFSLLNILLSSILLFIIYWYKKLNNHKGFNYWLLLAILFFVLSVDESASIHENFGLLYDHLVHKGIISPLLKTHTWLPFGVLFTLIVGIGLIPFFKLLSRTTLHYFLISGFIFISGAIGFELMGAIMLKTGFVEIETDLFYLLAQIFEEGCEMYGIAIFNCALYREISNKKISLVVGSA